MAKDRSALLSPSQRHLVTRFGYGIDATLARDVRRAGGAPAWFEQQLTRPGSFPDGAAENDDYGTDHGFGNVMFVAGAGVRGGRYYGSWPGLSDTPDADLLVTTDYRSVLAEVVTRRFGVSVAQVFPGFAPQGVGVMA